MTYELVCSKTVQRVGHLHLLYFNMLDLETKLNFASIVLTYCVDFYLWTNKKE